MCFLTLGGSSPLSLILDNYHASTLTPVMGMVPSNVLSEFLKLMNVEIKKQ